MRPIQAQAINNSFNFSYRRGTLGSERLSHFAQSNPAQKQCVGRAYSQLEAPGSPLLTTKSMTPPSRLGTLWASVSFHAGDPGQLIKSEFQACGWSDATHWLCNPRPHMSLRYQVCFERIKRLKIPNSSKIQLNASMRIKSEEPALSSQQLFLSINLEIKSTHGCKTPVSSCLLI